ncbi:hypothetical protein [Segetibacter koreensis]|uniref:hypothetical protein n=1 Tax=Segetibacter koreensis TaxID=398037 RepID=UPI001B7F828E|nr:hypothetical protein [Segetibacter koreensis]
MRTKITCSVIVTIALLLSTAKMYAQNAAKSRHLPIIDVHVHAMKVNPAFAADMCPWFLSNMPGGDPNQPPPSFINTDCATPLKAAKSDKEFQDSLIATMKRLNMTIIASGDASIIRRWQKAAEPGRVIPSLTLSASKEMTVMAFTDSLSSGFYKVMGEVAPQYQGMSPSDTSLDAYFGAAEKLNIPVGIHLGTGGKWYGKYFLAKIPCLYGKSIIVGRLTCTPSKT